MLITVACFHMDSLAAGRELAVDYNKFLYVLFVLEHKT